MQPRNDRESEQQQRINELEARLEEEEAITCILCEHIRNDRLKYCNEHHSVAHIYKQAKKKAREDNA